MSSIFDIDLELFAIYIVDFKDMLNLSMTCKHFLALMEADIYNLFMRRREKEMIDTRIRLIKERHAIMSRDPEIFNTQCDYLASGYALYVTTEGSLLKKLLQRSFVIVTSFYKIYAFEYHQDCDTAVFYGSLSMYENCHYVVDGEKIHRYIKHPVNRIMDICPYNRICDENEYLSKLDPYKESKNLSVISPCAIIKVINVSIVCAEKHRDKISNLFDELKKAVERDGYLYPTSEF